MKKFHFPYTVLMFGFGAILGAFDAYFELPFLALKLFSNLHIVIHLFLPVLIYNCAFGLNPHMFLVAISQCIILALPGFAFCATLNAVFAKIVLTEYQWDWTTCFLFGTILCASDPSAIIDLLEDYGVSSSLTTIIEGESLLNSGIALVLSKCFIVAIEGTHKPEELISDFVVSCLGALIFGYVVAIATVTLLRRTESDTDMEVTFTLCISYITYFISEMFLGISGILSLVVLGVAVSNYKSSINYEEEETTVHQFWQTLSFWANSLIFTIVGLIITTKVFKYIQSIDIGLIIATYFMASVFRGCMILIFSPLIKRMGYGLSWKCGAVLIWAGMRGAIGLALALMSQYTQKENGNNKLLIQVSGVIVLTLVFNASTLHWLLKLLGMEQVTSHNRESMAHAIALLRDAAITTERATRMDKYLSGVDWDWVHEVTRIQNPYEREESNFWNMSKWSFNSFRGHCKECNTEIEIEPNAEELRRMESDSRLLILRALKTSIVNQHSDYAILRRTLGHLNLCIEHTLDTSEKYLLAKDVKKKFLSINKYVIFLEKHLTDAMRRFKKRQRAAKERLRLEAIGSNAFRKRCIRIYLDRRFENLLYWVLLLNVIPIAGEFVELFRLNEQSVNLERRILLFEILNMIFALYYVGDAIIRVTALGYKPYFRSKGNIADFVITSIAVVQLFYALVLSTAYRHTRHYSHESFYVLVAMSATRLIRLLKVTCTGILSDMLNQCCCVFYNAFDLAIGFIVANEYIEKNAHKIVEYEECADFAQFTAENNVYEMPCYVNEVQEEHPNVVCAWRTHRATLYILRNMKKVIEEMVALYMIDEADAEQLLEEIASNMQDTITASRYMESLQGVRYCLENVQWIQNDFILNKILENHKIESFKVGEVIQESGKIHSNMKILFKGIIQISGTNEGEKESSLPNTDSTRYFETISNFSVHINNPETIGLLGYLLRTPSVTNTISSEYSQMITIDFEAISNIEKQFGSLSFCMWRPIALQIAASVLSEEQPYEKWPDEKLKIHLEEGIFPDLNETVEFDVHPIIDDMVLVQGRVEDKRTGIVYIGPAFIPNSVRSLILLDNPAGRPRVIMLLLREGKYHDFSILKWAKIEEIKYRGLCLVHGIRRASNLMEAEVIEKTLRRHSSFVQSVGKFFKPKSGSIMTSST